VDLGEVYDTKTFI
jgi:hypothetical protein